jgi:hypothetical protein
MVGDLFASPQRRLTRAKEHIADVESSVGVFFDTKPYARFVERNAKGLEEHKVRLTVNLPDRITDIAYEAIEALRSSLDQAAYAVAVASGVKRLDLVYFPIADDASQLQDVMRGRLKDFPPDILTLFRTFKPYPGGNDMIWALNRVRRQAAHRLIVPVGTATAGAFVKHVSISRPMPLKVFNVPRWDSEKNEMICLITGPGVDLEYDIDLTFFIAFGPVEGVAGLPVVDTLYAMAGEVERIIVNTEAEMRRLGLVT